MKIIACGGRDYQDYDRVIYCLNAAHKKHGISMLIEGGANGADAHAGIWAENNGIPRCTVHANWAFYGKRAGPIRNKAMLGLVGPEDAVIAFPGGAGTRGMVKLAEGAGVTVWVLKE